MKRLFLACAAVLLIAASIGLSLWGAYIQHLAEKPWWAEVCIFWTFMGAILSAIGAVVCGIWATALEAKA